VDRDKQKAKSIDCFCIINNPHSLTPNLFEIYIIIIHLNICKTYSLAAIFTKRAKNKKPETSPGFENNGQF
jgi:hypothetical protein